MNYRLHYTLALGCTLAILSAQGRQVATAPDQKKVVTTANRALEVLGLEKNPCTIEPSGSNPSNVFVFYKESNMLVDHVRDLVVYASNETLRREISQRSPGQSVIRRSDARWSELGLESAKKLWPEAKLTLKKVTRYPEDPPNPITGQRSPRSNTINLEYRGSVGTWRVRADIMFDQVTGKVSVVRMGDLPKPR